MEGRKGGRKEENNYLATFKTQEISYKKLGLLEFFDELKHLTKLNSFIA